MEPIYIPRLTKLPDCSETLEFKEFLPRLETLTPVQGVVRVTHKSNFLEAVLKGDSIITLCCDRCLQQYNHRLHVEASEFLWLTDGEQGIEEEPPLDEDLIIEEMVETLPRDGYFKVGDWIYEQFCLELPQRRLCSEDCAGIPVEQPTEATTDARWAALEALRGKLSN